jgi:eukaryotic-like serine/threonine-protein kinase
MSGDPGRMLGKYRLIAEIARGGMGIVYLAMVHGPAGFSKLVVIKELKPELVEDPAFLAMFLDEARLCARLSHPNIVQTNEVGNDGLRYFMAMDYLDGRGLDRIRRRSHKLGWGLTLPMHLRVVCDVLNGLDYAHKLTDFDGSPLGVVHRDVSPQNVFVTFDGQVKLLDFGIAKAKDSTNETHAGMLKGKAAYMSPEQARGHKVDGRADIFSVGIMLWEALAGKRMHEGQNEQQILFALASADLPRASTVKPWVPSELDDICARAMAYNRDARYATAGEFRDDLEKYLATSETALGARELATCVGELFKEERATMNTVIEAHVARARGAPIRDDLPVIELTISPLSADTPTVDRMSSGPFTGPQPDSLHKIPPTATTAAPSGPRNVVAPRSRRWVAIIGMATLAGAAAIVYLGTRDTGPATASVHEQPAPTPAPAVAPPPTAPATVAPKPRTIDVEVRVEPATATVTIDGVNVAGNPFRGKYVADDTVHAIHAEAPGFVAKTESISFDANVRLGLSLEREAPPQPKPVATARTPAPPPRPQTHAPARPATPAVTDVPHPPAPPDKPPPVVDKPKSSDVDPTGGNKPKRPIESTNPYGGT